MTQSSTQPPAVSGAHLRIDGLSFSFPDRRILTDVTFTAPAGSRTGLIGENGSGKTTLLRIIAGLLEPDAGGVNVSLPGISGADASPRIGLLHQQPPFDPADTVATAIEGAVGPVRDALQALDETGETLAQNPDDPTAARRYAEALETAERLEAWDVESRIERMLAGLGIGDLPRERSTGELSGGQRSRLALAWLLLSAPDVLLLDEPTNHLDDAATEHLRDVLAAWRGPVLLASHDRAFLDENVTALVDLDPAPLPHAVAGPLVGDGDGTGIGATRFSGTYTDYLHARLDARERWERQYRDEQAELKRLAAQLRDSHSVGNPDRGPKIEARAAKKFYADRNAKVVARRVNDARAAFEKLHDEQIRRPPAEMSFRGLTVASRGQLGAGQKGLSQAGRGQSRRAGASGPVLVASAVEVDGRLAATSLALSAEEKVLVTGPNGSGKSTLLAVLAGRLRASAGSVHTPAALRVGLLTQDVEFPDPRGRGSGRSVRDVYADAVGYDLSEEIPLGTFGLVAGRDETRPVGTLSVGQQRRLALAILLADPPDVLLLDEPTNHLSLFLVAQLEAAIPQYPGAVVVASHDRWLRNAWQGERVDLGSWGS